MVVVINQYPLTNDASSVVKGLQNTDILIATSEAVYGANSIARENPHITVYAVNSDCGARGITVDEAILLDDLQLAALSQQHKQWISLP